VGPRRLRRHELTVQRDLALLSEQLKRCSRARPSRDRQRQDVVLTSNVSSKDIIEKAVNVAAGCVDKEKSPRCSSARGGDQPGAAPRRFAEVSRTR
jgi:hypothetical protein